MTITREQTKIWIHSLCADSSLSKATICAHLAEAGVQPIPLEAHAHPSLGVMILDEINQEACNLIRTVSRSGAERVLVLIGGEATFPNQDAWRALQAGASDIFVWNELPAPAEMIAARLQRWQAIDELVYSPLVQNNLIGQSQSWLAVLRQIVEIARFTDAPVLLLGETGTGKELMARLIHTLDLQRGQHELVVLDCTTIVPELSGSELFGHERGAYTGAVSTREGAFALANGGTLFLDEIGELPLTLQVQLLRVLQEHTYKRVGGNQWRNTDFRLICATNRDLSNEEACDHFRRDLYYRISSWVVRLPPLRERTEDILPLVHHFIQQARPGEPPLELDERLQEYLLTRPYPGNVRDLKNLVQRIAARHVGPGPITIGAIPSDERPLVGLDLGCWCDAHVDQAIRHALSLGVGLKDLRRTVEEAAIRIAVDDAFGNLQQAADRLGVTDRALQLRRAKQHQSFQAELYN
jgi:transcriptional regulator with GAF, ATPase, and Fis domain